MDILLVGLVFFCAVLASYGVGENGRRHRH